MNPGGALGLEGGGGGRRPGRGRYGAGSAFKKHYIYCNITPIALSNHPVSNQPENSLSDKYLVEKVLRGDSRAFAGIIQRTEGLVAQIIFKMIDHAEDRKDLAQEVYIKAFNSLSGFRFQAKLSTWIAQITYNSCLNHLTRKKLVLPGDLSEDNHPGHPLTDDPFIFTHERTAILRAAIERLSPIHKTLITLYHQEEMSYEEIGEITGLPQGTVKSYLFRARKALKDSLMLNYKKEEL
jgi:RNA polymerase sigma-70 factor (ECF subfamily)